MNEKGIKDLQASLKEFEQEGTSLYPAIWFWDDFLKRNASNKVVHCFINIFWCLEMNQYAKVEFLPIVFATKRSIYSKYMSYMILQRNHLLADVMDGLFFLKLSEGKFNSVWIDYVLEANEKRAFKGTEGIIKLTLKGQALAR